MPANVFLKFFMVSSPSGPPSAITSSSFSLFPFPFSSFPFPDSGLSFGRGSTFFTAEVALLAPDTELVSEAEIKN